MITIAGFEPGHAERQALHAIAAQHQTLIQIHSDAAPPHSWELLVLQDMDGEALNRAGMDQFWHTPPYAMPLRLVRYAPNSCDGEVVDGAVISTRDERNVFRMRVERMVVRLVGNAIAGTGRGAFCSSFDPTRRRRRRWPFAGRFDHFITCWRQRLLAEWWSIGFTTMPLEDILESGLLGSVQWLGSRAGTHYLADPFTWPGTGRLLCEQRSVVEGNGSIVAIDPGPDGTFRHISTILAGSSHHSYPCVVQDGEAVYFLPEAPERGGTVLYRLTEDSDPVPVCRIAPGRRVADPTLFAYGGRYWIAYTDLDIGEHNNLCLLHAPAIEGPWQPHRCVPVKIDVCGARSAGVPIRIGDTLFRPGQDCAQTYGAGLVIHRVDLLTPEDYRETVVTHLRPDPSGPFPHGMHTLSAEEGRVWLDGKRYIFSFSSLIGKLARRAWRGAKAPQAAPRMMARPHHDGSPWRPPTRVGTDSQPLSVAMYIPSLAGGGAERQYLSLARELHRSGLGVTLVLNRVQGELVADVPAGIRVVGLNGRRTLHDVVLLARFLRREQPDILLTNLDHNNIAGCLAKIVAGSRTKVVIYQHNALAREFATAERWTYHLVPLGYRLLSPWMAAAVGVSDGIARELVNNAGLPSEKVATIHNMAIGHGFQDRAAEHVDHPWFGDRSSPLLVTAGRFVPQKDHETLLSALALHRRGGGRGRLLILGSGPLDEALRVQAAALGLEESVCFVGFRANPLPWFRCADVFVLSSRSEGFGNVLVEAMACGTPVISTDCDHGPREILQDGRYGVLVPPRDPQALANAFDTARDLRAQFPSDMLIARAAAFSSAACTASFLALFEKLLWPNRLGRRPPVSGLTLASATADTSGYHRRSNNLQDC